MTTPPGWYRDPSAPHTERWWDGTAWTEHRRTPEVSQQQLQHHYPQQQQSYAQPQTVPMPARAGSGRAKAVALTTAAAVLVAAIVTGAVVLSRDDGDSEPGARTAPTPTATAPTSSPPSPSESAGDDPAVVVDELNGITLPVLDGWAEPKNVSDTDIVLTTPGTYRCPGDDGLCRHGTVLSRTVTANDEKSPATLARQDISDAADLAYDRDRIDRRPFRGITSHKLVEQGPVAVAGRTGHLVRWRVTTEVGPGGYVQSMAFPSSVGSESMVMVRYVFDAGEDGPPLADMDRITEGIRPVGDEDTSGGVGSSIGPTQ
ncbi:DUF2510 domain-containing protein [Streptomyces aurantiacus]|nr:DUF2510 domain-containing protein [Streptomyces aurantiacus]